MEWKETYPRKTKPTYDELLDYFPEDICMLFLRFDLIINLAYGNDGKGAK